MLALPQGRDPQGEAGGVAVHDLAFGVHGLGAVSGIGEAQAVDHGIGGRVGSHPGHLRHGAGKGDAGRAFDGGRGGVLVRTQVVVVGGAAQEAHAHLVRGHIIELAVVQVIDRLRHLMAQVGELVVGVIGRDGDLVVAVAGVQHGGVRGHVLIGPAGNGRSEATTEHREATGHGIVHMEPGTGIHRGGSSTSRRACEDGLAVHGRAIHHQQGTAAEGNSRCTCAARSITHGQAAVVHQLQFLARVVGSTRMAGLGHGLLRLFGTGTVSHQTFALHGDALTKTFGGEAVIGVKAPHFHDALAGGIQLAAQMGLVRHQSVVHKRGIVTGDKARDHDGQITGGGVEGTLGIQLAGRQEQIIVLDAGVALCQRQGLAGIHHALTGKIAIGSAADDDILASLYQRTVFQAQGTDQDMIAGQDIGSISVDAQMMVGRRIIEIANGFLYLQRDVTGIDNACIRVIAIDPHGDDDAGGITILA